MRDLAIVRMTLTRNALGPLSIALACVALVALTWRRWADPSVDFGREVYAAWQLSQGAQLYRDIAWFNGPLPDYWNAFWFRLFGPSLTVLFSINLVLLAGFLALLYTCVRAMSDRLTATAAALVVLALFALAQVTPHGGHNFIAPYCYAATYGLMCGFAAVALIGRWGRGGSRSAALWAGVFAGLATLTKVEMAVAGIAGPLAGIVIASRASGRGEALRAALHFLSGACAVVALGFVALARYSGTDLALEAVTASWRGLSQHEVMALPFYRIGMGLDDVPGQLTAMAVWSLRWALILAPAVLFAFHARSRPDRAIKPTWFAVLNAFAALLIALSAPWDWLQVALPLPVATALVAVALVVSPRADGGTALPVALAVFALALLGKMLLNARLHHYGFVLALPATVLLVIALLYWLPREVERRGGRGDLMRAASIGILLFSCAFYASVGVMQQLRKTATLGAGGDALVADSQAPIFQQALDALAAKPPEATLAVLPETALLNYLARRRNPTPYLSTKQVELLVHGEPNVIAAFAAHPPDYIALVHRDTGQRHPEFFGRDYGKALAAWVTEHYEPEAVFGDPPLQPGSTFGIAILKRKAAPKP